MPLELTIHTLDELPVTAKNILSYCSGKKIFAFSGEMGAGKTTLIKAFCTVLGSRDKAVSPTFSIINEYHGIETIYHVDLYRLKTLSEAIDIGIEEYINSGNYCFIEWPELIKDLLPPATLWITIMVTSGNDRKLEVDYQADR